MKRRTFLGSASALVSAIALPTATVKAALPNGNNTPNENPEYCADYSLRDHEILEYSFYQPPELPGMLLRGPAVDISHRDDYFSCIGAAQTLGVYSPTPFPQLLTQQLGITSWNLGVGGASPHFFLQHPELFSYINKGKFVILQIMTARSEDNDRIQRTPVTGMVKDKKRGDVLPGGMIWQRILEEEPENVAKYIAQSQDSWEQNMRKLIAKIEVPIIHFWFSPKKLDSKIHLDSSVIGIIDTYPQFINKENLGFISPDNPLVTCLSDRDMQFELRSRYTGKQVEVDYAAADKSGTLPSFRESRNIYYPSPQMHWDAALILGEEIQKRQLF